MILPYPQNSKGKPGKKSARLKQVLTQTTEWVDSIPPPRNVGLRIFILRWRELQPS